MDLKKCQIFTPTETVKFMLDQVGYNNRIFGKKIIDNACGNGSFLIEILRRFLQDAKKRKVSKTEIKHKIEQCIWGYEIDPEKHKECIEKLNKEIKLHNIRDVHWNIHCLDGLFVEQNGEFDYVVGNPPYVAYKDLTKKIRKDLKNYYISCSKGKFDYSYAFIEKGLNFLKPKGRMIMISPSNMFKAVFGESLRDLIKPHIIAVINCWQDKIFDRVLTSPSITIYQKNSQKDSINYQFGLKGMPFEIDKKELREKWVFGETNFGLKRFGDFFTVSNSIATLLNKAFIHNVDENGQVVIDCMCIEPGILKVAKSPRSEKYLLKQKIIFPYRYEKGKLIHMGEEEIASLYPNAYSYLIRQKENLQKRDSDHSASWFEFGRSQALAHLNRKKLLMSSIITNEVVIYELAKEEIPYSGVYIIPKANKTLTDAIKILKSKEFYKYLLGIGIPVSGDSIRISSKDIENFKFEE